MANKPTPADFSPTVPDFPNIGTYQPVYGKFDLTTYIQGASDYEIMAFLVQCYNATLKGYSDVTQLSKDTVTAYNQLQTWVNTWFDELDVQQEINNKLQSMYEAGTLANSIAQSNAIPPAVAQYLNSIEGTQNLSNVTAQKIEAMAASGALGTVINNTGEVQSTTTNWLQQNVTPTGSAVMVDKSLSISGAAADAKVVGDSGFLTRAFYSADDMNTMINCGIYGLNAARQNGKYGLALGTYAFMLVFKNSTGSVRDVCQEVITFNETSVGSKNFKIYYRSSVGGVFGNFEEYDQHNAVDFRPRAFNYTGSLNDALEYGTYGLNSSAYNGTLGLSLGTYAFMNVYHNSTQALADVCQEIITFKDAGSMGSRSFRLYFRSSVAGVFGNFEEYDPYNSVSFRTRAFNYSGSLNKALECGTYGLKVSTYNGTLGLSLGTYAFMNVYHNSTLSSIDVCQEIITFDEYNENGHSGSRAFRVYLRSSIAGTFGNFTLLNSYSKNNVCFIGDSFTDEFVNDPKRHSYVYYLSKSNKYACTNYGVSGATAYSWYIANKDKITDEFDTYFIALGLNFNDDEPGDNDGSIDDTIDSHTFYGSMNAILGDILNVNPKARVIIWCMDAWYAQHRSDACKNLANKWGCEYYSMKADSNIPIRNGGKYENVMPGLSTDVVTAKNKAYFLQYPTDSHPNNDAQKMLADYLINII